MKQLLVLFGCCVILFGPAGCQNANRGIEVIVEGNGKFPESFAGRWRANKGFWEFVFEPDGRISSAAIGLGGVEMKPGQVTRFRTRNGGKGVFKPGLWTVQYNPEYRELTVEVVIEHFYQDLGKHAIEGDSTDIFTGQVSENSDVWQADWFSFGKYIAHIPEPNEFYNVPEPEFKGSVIFEKVEQEK